MAVIAVEHQGPTLDQDRCIGFRRWFVADWIHRKRSFALRRTDRRSLIAVEDLSFAHRLPGARAFFHFR
jgi:hypothetical protein